MTDIKCLNGPAKGFEATIEQDLAMGDVVSIPVDDEIHSNGQMYAHYTASGFINGKWLLCETKLVAEAANNG